MMVYIGFEQLSCVDHNSPMQDRVKLFSDSYKSLIVVDPHEENYFNFVFPSLCNIVSAVCEDEDYVFGSDGVMVEDCFASSFFDGMDESLVERGWMEFKNYVFDTLLKEERYEFLEELKKNNLT
jgi:hypothetical protein